MAKFDRTIFAFARTGPDHALRMPGADAARHTKSVSTQVSAVGDYRLSGGFGNNLCRCAGFNGNDQTSLKRRYEPKDGRNHWRLSDLVGLLRFVDRLAAGNRVECDRCLDQFHMRRRIWLFRPRRESQIREKPVIASSTPDLGTQQKKIQAEGNRRV